MSAILELPEVRARVARWSVKDYEALGEQGVFGKNVELVRGIVVQKMSKSPLHFNTTQWLRDWCSARLPAGFVVRQEGPLRLADSEPEPDIAVVRGSERDFWASHPTTAALVVEVAVTSAALDRENASLYAEAGVEEYWIVLAGERAVEVYRQPAGGAYQQKRLASHEETLVCASVPGLELSLRELFA